MSNDKKCPFCGSMEAYQFKLNSISETVVNRNRHKPEAVTMSMEMFEAIIWPFNTDCESCHIDCDKSGDKCTDEGEKCISAWLNAIEADNKEKGIEDIELLTEEKNALIRVNHELKLELEKEY